MRKICGVELPKSISTSSNVVYLKMSYDNVRKGSKFLLEWSEIDFATEGAVTSKPKGLFKDQADILVTTC